MVNADPKYAEILFPYLNGDDLNSSPDFSASRWVISFYDWPLDRVKGYPLALEHLRENVKPERDSNKRQNYREAWWRHGEHRPGLYGAISGLRNVISITRHSKFVMPVMVPTGQIISDACVVFATEDLATLAFLSSAPHYWWTITRSSTLETRIRYTHSDVFETLPLPALTEELRSVGQALHDERSAFMLGRQLGLTNTYNLVHDPAAQETAVRRLRDLHVEIDKAVLNAYGWTDLVPAHGHYDTRQGLRWTVAPAVQTEILDRLLELNLQRYTEEAAAGLHDQGAKGRMRKKTKAVGDVSTLFGGVPTLFGGVPTLFGEDT